MTSRNGLRKNVTRKNREGEVYNGSLTMTLIVSIAGFKRELFQLLTF